MRLSKIKLSGFKSFVDTTTIKFPSNLMGIVGPNGCGKSNIIDAIRWVLGEASAKTLRGDSMVDVIFNGSANRKPVGLASIELTFDNSDGTITGAFAGYNEVSVRRVVSRIVPNVPTIATSALGDDAQLLGIVYSAMELAEAKVAAIAGSARRA